MTATGGTSGYAAILEHAPVIVYAARLDDVRSPLFVSPQVKFFLGYSPADWTAEPGAFVEALHPDDRDRVLAEHARVRHAREPFRMEYRLVGRDRQVVWFRDEGRPAGDELHGVLVDISDRKHAEDALRASEQRRHRLKEYYESVLAMSPAAIALFDLDERVTSWNPAAERLFGYTQDEAIGRPIAELILRTEELEGEGRAVAREAVESGAARLVTRRMHKDGSLVDVEVLVVPLVVEGERQGSFAIYHDVSDLQRERQYFASLMEVNPTAVVTLDLDDRITAWNRAAEELFGHTRDEVIGLNIDAVVASREDLCADAVDLNRRAAAREQVHHVTQRLRKDGSLVDVEVVAAPIVMGGEHIATYVSYHDISALQHQKQYFATLLQASPTAIVTIDTNYDITQWNAAAERLFGYTREEALGRNLDRLVARTDELHAEAVDLTHGASEEQVHLVTQRTRKDGSLVDVEISAVPVVVSGERVGACAIYHDITELLRARREAEAANRAKSTFLATMSHEIRTPMNAVIGMTELLLGTDLDPEQREYAEIVRTSGDALLAVIDDILDFSKIESGKLDLERTPFDVHLCVESTLDLLARRVAEKGLELAGVIDPATPRWIVGDPTRLRQILINLLSNAVKFTEAGEIVVDVRPLPDERRLRFSVRDTGIGIPPDRMDRLFRSFTQVDASTTRRYGGTGLGLAISRRLAELMGGEMTVESRVGEGSVFAFTIGAEPADGLAAQHDPGVQPDLAGRRLLIVDDNATNRRILVSQVQSWGMTALAASSPAEALAALRRGEPFDLAILDMHMPEIDGVQLAQQIRRLRDPAALPLVLLTSLGNHADLGGQDVAGHEFAARITKPVKASQLYNALLAVVAHAPPADLHARRQEPAGAARPLRILVVEDNEINQRLALLVLEKLGYDADMASNGVEALTALERARYDVVLMDVEMPEMDGLEASRRIRARWPGAEGPRIVAMTANVMRGDRERCLAAGMDDYLTKPIRTDELAAALDRTPTGTVLDEAALADLRATAGDPGLVAELTDIFLQHAPALLASVKDGVAHRAADDVRRAAHTLKSNARTFGAAALAETCQAVEARARSGSLDGAEALVERMEVELWHATGALKALRQEG